MPKLGFNILVSVYRRVNGPDDNIGGAVESLQRVAHDIPARITGSTAPLFLRAQGIETSDFFTAVLTFNSQQGYNQVDVRADDVLIAQNSRLHGSTQFKIQSVEDASIDDNPNTYAGFNKKLALKRDTPRPLLPVP
jgi:hypothetical protein